MKIKMKIVIPMAVLTLFVAAMILASNIIQFTNYIDTFMKDRISSASEVASSELVRLKSGSNTASLYISSDSVIIEALMTGDRDALMYRAKQMRADTNVEFCTIMDADGIVLVRPHEPEKFGDSLASQANVRAAMSGNSLTAIEQGTAVRLSVRSGAPIYDTQGRLIGVVSTGYRLDTDTFVDSIKALMNCEVAVFLGDEQISTTVLKDDGTRAVGTKAPEDISKTVLTGNTYSGTAQLLDRDANTKYSPIYGTDGKVLGMLLVGRYTTEETKMTWSFILIGLLITFILLAVSIPAILFIAGRIAAPLNAMVVAADALAVGDTEISVTVNTRDETRDLADAFNKMTNNIRRQVEIISAIASGDISVAVEERSDKDVMNQALKTMLFNNNSVFSEIINSAQQVSSGSRQVADGSQTLAQGTAEQAAAVEQLSCFVSEIAGKTKENENLAVRTAALACKIKDNAERGNRQMGEMMAAVREINHASNSISKVIKVIDDIAFQTNILALNAAVEAARAGQHGKGFAVVAEEVRNLAAKSAEAAKNTAELIANSVEKAELGARIADETAASLIEIVDGITESNRLVGEIASSSAVQSVGISQINKGIEQVAHVIQQNSATAEESAAASEEMNCQAKILEDLMSQFKLANNGMYSVKSLPSHQIKQGKALFTSADENRLSGNH